MVSEFRAVSNGGDNLALGLVSALPKNLAGEPATTTHVDRVNP